MQFLLLTLIGINKIHLLLLSKHFVSEAAVTYTNDMYIILSKINIKLLLSYTKND